MQQGWELSSWLWRPPLVMLLWLSGNLIVLLLFVALALLARSGAFAGRAVGHVSDYAMALCELWARVAFWSLPVSAALGLVVIILTLVLRLTGRVSFADSHVRRALWMAGADVAIPVALVGALLLYLWYNPPKLMF